MNIIEFWDKFLGGGKPSWRVWRVRLKAAYGIPLEPDELPIFRKHTGRMFPWPGGHDETLDALGRRTGKSWVRTLESLFTAFVYPGSSTGLAAQGFKVTQAVLLGYIMEMLDSAPALKRELARETADSVEFRNGSVIKIYPCTSRSIRGSGNKFVGVDEIDHFESTEGRPVDREMLTAVRPTLLTTRGRLSISSSPYRRTGVFYDLVTKHFGKEDSPVLVWRATSIEMNPTLPLDRLEQMRIEDPIAYQSEVLAEFPESGATSFFEMRNVLACVPLGIAERLPTYGRAYVGFCDVASGSGSDSATLAIAHREGDVATLDCIRSVEPPFDPVAAVGIFGRTLATFGLAQVEGDRYSQGFVAAAFKDHGVSYKYSERNRSEIFLEALPLINSRRALLLDDPVLLRELQGLQRARGTGGRDKVDHASGGHDDRANSVCGALVSAGPLRSTTMSGIWRWEPGLGPFAGGPISGQSGSLIWRNGRPWSGICPPDRDLKGRATSRAAVYLNGEIIRYLDATEGRTNTP